MQKANKLVASRVKYLLNYGVVGIQKI